MDTQTQILTDRDREVLENLNGQGWVRPLDLGGHSGSHHNKTLTQLVKRGLVERKERRGHFTRASYLYRITKQGREVLAQ